RRAPIPGIRSRIAPVSLAPENRCAAFEERGDTLGRVGAVHDRRIAVDVGRQHVVCGGGGHRVSPVYGPGLLTTADATPEHRSARGRSRPRVLAPRGSIPPASTPQGGDLPPAQQQLLPRGRRAPWPVEEADLPPSTNQPA